MALTQEQLQYYRKKYKIGTVNQTSNTQNRLQQLRISAGLDTKNQVSKQNIQQETQETQQKKGIGRKILDFFTSSEQAFGETLGGAMATFSGKKLQEESTKTYQELGDAVLKQLKNPLVSDENKKRIVEMYSKSNPEILSEEVNPALAKTAKQIYGEGLGVFMDIASFGKYGKGLNVSKAKTAGEAFKIGAKKFGLEGAVLGTGFGVAGAMQEDKNLADITKAGITGGITGGIISGVIGGLSARKQYLLPEKAEALKQKAIEQYKRGLNATKEKYKEKTQKIIPDLLDDKVWGTHKQLMQKAEQGIALSNQEYQQLGKLKGYANISGIQNMIDDEIAKYTLASGRVASINQARVKALEELKLDLLAIDTFDKIKDNKASQQALRELAQQYGEEIYQTRKAQKTIMDNKTLSQVKKVDSAIRELLNTDPRNIKYSKINEVYHLNSELAEILNETAIRKEGHKLLNIIRSLSFGGGAVTGAVVGGAPGVVIGGLSLGVLGEILNSTWWNTLRAVQKNQLAKKLEQKAGQELSQALILLSRQGIKYAEQLINE